MTEEQSARRGNLLSRPTSLAGTFNKAASAYDARPGYPPEVYDLLTRTCGLGPGTTVVEIGPGAGQATLPLLERGAHVVAVEPGAELARLLRDRAPAPNLDMHVARFEDVPLDDGAFDMVCAATSFHWVDPTIGIEKAARLLREGGWLALWWTIWGDPSRPDILRDALVPILKRKAPELTRHEHGPDAYRQDLEARIGMIEASGWFGPMHEERIEWEVTQDPVTLRRIFATFAAWIALPDDVRNDLLNDVETIARDTFGGAVRQPYQTAVYLAQRREAAQ